MVDKKPVVVVGSINIDLVANTERIPAAGETVSGSEFHLYPGGKGANQAVAVARLGYPVRMIGRLGHDPFGAQLRTYLETAGADVLGVGTSGGASGVAIIVVSNTGENIIVVTPGANALVTPKDLEDNIEILRSAGIVLAQLEIPMGTIEHLAHLCTREGIPLVLDPAPATELPEGLLANVAWLTPNETEAAFYGKQSAKKGQSQDYEALTSELLSTGARGVVLKLGSRGAFVASTSSLGEHVSSFKVKAIDTTAAGDCFNGAFAVGLMMGKTAVESARFAAAAAAISVTRAGAQPSMPTMAEVMDLLDPQDL